MNRKLLLSFCLSLVFFIPTTAFSKTLTEKKCSALFQQQGFVEAGKCFRQLASTIKQHQKDKAKEKGRFLRNAAIALWKAGKAEPIIDKAGFYREQAITLLKEYTSKKLCGSVRKCGFANGLIATITKEVGYNTLTFLLNNKKARHIITGYQYRKDGQGDIILRLRPGTYKLQAIHPDGKRRFDKTLVVEHKKKGKPQIIQVESFRAAQKKVVITKVTKFSEGYAMTTGERAMFWGGLSTSVIGLGMFLVGVITNADGFNEYLTPEGSLEKANNRLRLAKIGYGSGGALIAVGTGLTVTSLVLSRNRAKRLKKKVKKADILDHRSKPTHLSLITVIP